MKNLPLHPIFISLFVVLSIYASNSTQVPIEQLVRPLAINLLIATSLYTFSIYLFKDRYYAAFAASWVLLWFYFFGHVFQAVNLLPSFKNNSHNEFVLLGMWTLTMVFLGTPWAWNRIRNKKIVNEILTTMSLGAAIVPLYTIGLTIYHDNQASRLINDWQVSQPKIEINPGADLPDIYYIILDGYGRQDILNDYYSFDNSKFIQDLTQRGFFVASQSHSNYMQSSLSLASSLNMEYINFLSNVDTDIRYPAYKLIADSRIRNLLENSGYKTVNISSMALFTQLSDFDLYLTPGNSILTQFEKLLISTTAFAVELRESNLLLPSYHSHRLYTLFAFDSLIEVAKVSGPKFVFVHIVAPHPPFVFDAKGNPVQPDRPYLLNDASGFPGPRNEYIDGYTNEIQFINSLTLQSLDGILSNSTRPAIIILQGDHGPGANTNLFDYKSSCNLERSSILNAYYFPDQDYELLSQDIFPVNSFRVVLDQFFGANLALLENHTYFSFWDDPFKFIDATDSLDQPCK